MSDQVDPSSFRLFWGELSSSDEESMVQIEVDQVDEEFLGRFGLQLSDLTGNPFEGEDHLAHPDIPKVCKEAPESESGVLEEIKNVIMEDDSEAQSSAAAGKEFTNMTMTDVQSFISAQENTNTMRKTLQDVRKFERFLKSKGETRKIFQIDAEQLDQYTANFILSARKLDGGEYEPSSLRGIISSLERTLRKHKYPHTIMHEDGAPFSLTRDALKSKQKALKKMGKGNKPRQSAPITDGEIDIMYKKEILGDSNPGAVLNTMWLNNCIHFGLRGTKEQYNLRWGDITLNTCSDGTEYLELNERQTKTRTGENTTDTRKVTPKMFATADPSRDPVAIYKLYASKRPASMLDESTPFYISPRTTALKSESDAWFLNQRVGEKKLGGLLKHMAVTAGLNETKNLTNHSARKHLVQKLRDSNIAPTDIMQISGHKNVQSIISYSNISEEKQKQCSNILANQTLTMPQPMPGPSTIPQPQISSTIPRPCTSSSICESVPSTSDITAISDITDTSDSNAHTESAVSLSAASPSYPTHFDLAIANNNQMLQSAFFGATLNIQTLNFYGNK